MSADLRIGLLVESGYWCHTEGIYFTDKSEHQTEEEWRKTELGGLGHYGYECAGAEETIAVAVIERQETA